MQDAVHSMDNLNINKALTNELQEAHDMLYEAGSSDEDHSDDGFMKKYSDRLANNNQIEK